MGFGSSELRAGAGSFVRKINLRLCFAANNKAGRAPRVPPAGRAAPPGPPRCDPRAAMGSGPWRCPPRCPQSSALRAGRVFSRLQTEPGRDASVRPARAQAASRPQDAFVSQGSPTVQQRELPAAASKGQLLDWARGTYGGITSYSELRDPRAIRLCLGEGALGTGAGGEGGHTGWHQGGEEGAAGLSLLPEHAGSTGWWFPWARAHQARFGFGDPQHCLCPPQMPAAPRTASPRSASTPRRTWTPSCFPKGCGAAPAAAPPAPGLPTSSSCSPSTGTVRGPLQEGGTAWGTWGRSRGLLETPGPAE